MLVHRISSWAQWKKMIPGLGGELPFGNEEDEHISSLLFRGHRCCSWELESTLERKGIELPYLDSYAREIKSVKLAFESYLGTTWSSEFSISELPGPPEEYEFMVYLRHHGYPTPLLDWTRSPYVAAFFAFQNLSEEESVAIFSFREYVGETKTGWTGDSNIVGCGPTIRSHRRHYAQQAEYTYCRKKLDNGWVYSSHEKALEETGGSQDVLQKYILSSGMRREALADLDLMNINAYTLFGSEEGLAEMLANRKYSYEA